MKRVTLTFALIGLLIAASTIEILVLPHWIALLSGPLFALAVLLGNLVSRLRAPLAAFQYALVAILYSAAHIVVVPLVWNLADLHIASEETLIQLGPTIGTIVAGVIVLVGLAFILKRTTAVSDRYGIALAAFGLIAGESAAVLLELWGRFYRFFHYQPATSSLMASFAVLCGYIGHRLGAEEYRGEGPVTSARRAVT